MVWSLENILYMHTINAVVKYVAHAAFMQIKVV